MNLTLPIRMFIHPKNNTAENERALEIGLIKPILPYLDARQGLEIGNVLSNYAPVSHTVVDKFDGSPVVTQADIVTWNPGRTFRWIVSISTMEHVGFCEDPATQEKGDPTLVVKAIKNIQSMMSVDGVFAFTFPIGYNVWFDSFVVSNRNIFDVLAFERVGVTEWVQSHAESAVLKRYGQPFKFGNGLFVVFMSKREDLIFVE